MPYNSAYMQCMDSVKTAIEALSLTGLSTVVIQEWPLWVDRALPYVSISPSSVKENVSAATNRNDEVGYAILVAIIAAQAGTDLDALDARLLWRQTIRRRFSNQSISGITAGTQLKATVEPLSPIDAAAMAKFKSFVSGLIVRVSVRELHPS
jgi:hypothetical protein